MRRGLNLLMMVAGLLTLISCTYTEVDSVSAYNPRYVNGYTQVSTVRNYQPYWGNNIGYYNGYGYDNGWYGTSNYYGMTVYRSAW